MTYLEAILLAIVEGATEFLPISSTGHMILTSSLLGVEQDSFFKLYIVAIQFGTILSVIALYWRRLVQHWHIYLHLAAAVVPTALIALLLKKYVDLALGSVTVVAINLVLGGCIMIYLERYFKQKTGASSELNIRKSVIIGLVQSLSIFPGVSRSAATIYGGMSQGLNRRDAAEFSFLLAVPIMFLATAKDLFDYGKEFGMTIPVEEIKILFVGNVVGFIVAILSIRWLVNFISSRGFLPFAYYRIMIGLAVLACIYVFHMSLKLI